MGGFLCLVFGDPTKALQGFGITLTQAADVALDIAFQRAVGRLNPHTQLCFGQGRSTQQQKKQRGEKVERNRHEGDASTSSGPT